jgi:hypothetical protein
MLTIREVFKRVKDRGIRFAFESLVRDEYLQDRMRGEVFWTLRDSATGKETRGHHKNVVTLDAGILLATFMKGTGTAVANQCVPSFGVYALGVGTGDVSWDPMSPPPATITQRSLYNELARKAVAVTSFIDEEGSISGVRTHIVDYTVTFTESEAVGALTEMGLLGGDIDTSMAVRNPILPPNGPYDPTVDTSAKDILINYVTFPAINKPPTSTLNWVWRLVF